MCVFMKIFPIYLVSYFSIFVNIDTLSIESNLGRNEDCFERVALGKSLPLDVVTGNRTDNSLSDCEKLCLVEEKCQSFDYGVGARGNSTCHMSSSKIPELQSSNKIVGNNDYDLYSRRPKCELAAPSPLKPNTGGTVTPKPMLSTTPGYIPYYQRPLHQHDKWDNYVYRKHQNRPQEIYNTQNIAKPLYQNEGSNYYNRKPVYSQLISISPINNNLPQNPQYSTSKPQNEYHIIQHGTRPLKTPSYQSGSFNQMVFTNKPDSYQHTSHYLHKPHSQIEDSLQYETQTQQNTEYQSGNLNQNPYLKEPSFPENALSSSYKPQQQNHYLNKPTYPKNTWSNRPNFQAEDNNPQYETQLHQKPDDNENYNLNVPIQDQVYNTEPSSFSMNRPPNNYYSDYKRPVAYNKIPRPISYTNQNKYKDDTYFYDTHKRPSNFDLKPQDSSSYLRPHFQNPYTFQRPSGNYGSLESGYLGYDKPDYRPSYANQQYNYSNEKPYNFDYNDFLVHNYFNQDDSFHFNARPTYQNHHYKPFEYTPHKPTYQDVLASDYSGQFEQISKPQSSYNQNTHELTSGSNGGFQSATSLYKPGFQLDESSSKPNPGYNLNFNDNPPTASHLLFKPISNYGNKPTDVPSVVILSSNYGTSTETIHTPADQDENRPDPLSYKPNNDPDIDNAFDKPPTSNIPTYETGSTGNKPNVYTVHDTTQYVSQRPQTHNPHYGNNDLHIGVPQGGTYGLSLINRPQEGGIHTNRPQFSSSSNQENNYGSFSHTNRPQYLSPTNHAHSESSHTNRPSYQSQLNQENIYDSKDPHIPHFPSENFDGSSYINRPAHQSTSNQDNIYGSSQINRPQHTSTNKPNQVKPIYEYDRPTVTRPIYVQKPSGQVVTTGQVSVSSGSSYVRPGVGVITELKPTYTTCYRRVVAGKRVLRGYVLRALPCESLVDCQRACADEARFHCESFNYKLDASNRGKGLCELMEKPIEHLDLEKDFVEDKEYDFYELDRNSLQPDCALTWPGVPYPNSGFLGGQNRPQNDWQSSHQNSYGRWGSKFEDVERYNRLDTRVQAYNRVGYDSGRHNNHIHGSYNRRKGYEDVHRYTSLNYWPGKRTPVGFDHFVPYQIAGGRSEEETWGRYGGSYGGSQEHGREDKNSYDYWGLGEVDGTQYQESRRYLPNTWDSSAPGGVRSHPSSSRADFNYGNLGRQNWDGGNNLNSYSYGYGSPGHGNQYSKDKESFMVTGTGFDTAEHTNDGGFTGADNSHGYQPDRFRDGCSSRRRAGAGLGSRAVRLALRVHDVLACEAACFQQTVFKCVSYSFRYSKQETENCFLSEVPYKGLDLTSDSGSDVYTMQGSSCRGPSVKPWIESECFWHVRAGRKLTHNAIHAGLITTGLGACEAECIRAHGFVCRAFSFRFGSPTIGDDPENCLLTSLGSTDLSDSWNSLEASEGHELYARGSFGRGCELTVLEEITPANKEEQCYLQYDSSARLLPSAVRYPTFAKDSHSCRDACSKARLEFEQAAARAKRSFSHHHATPPLVRCMSYSFSSEPQTQSNCLLSDIRLIDLQLGLDYEHSNKDWLFAFDLFNKECWSTTIGSVHHHDIKHGDDGYLPDRQFTSQIPRPSLPPIFSGPSGSGPIGLEPPHPAPVPTFDHHYKPTGPPDHPYIASSPPGHHTPSSYPYKPSGSEVGIGTLDRIPDAGGPGYLPHGGQSGDRGYDYFDDEGRGAWSQYTVSGWPCRAGSRCGPNVITGYWSCELEGGEVGAWDYCCTPEHHCGYSEGFNKPWCYVGPSREQWRPCNDKYYPYHQAMYNKIRPSQEYPTSGPDHNYHNTHHFDRPALAEHYGSPGNIPLTNLRPSGSYPEYDARPVPSSGYEYESSSLGRPYYHEFEGPHRKPGNIPSGGEYGVEDERKYWDDLYKNGPQSYYDNHGNPRPGYVRIPTVEGPRVHYQHNSGPPHSDSPHWVPVPPPRDHDYLNPSSSGFGTPRYWPVAYLHKSSPPNTTYYNYNENNNRPNDRKDKFDKPNFEFDKGKRPNESKQVLTIDTTIEKHKVESGKNITDIVKNVGDGISNNNEDLTIKPTDENTKDISKNLKGKVVPMNNSETTTAKIKNRSIEGIDDKLEFSDEDIEILSLDDAKTADKKAKSNIEILESEERQIEALGRLLASRRDGQLIEKRSQNENDAKNIQIAFESTTQKNHVQRQFIPVSKSKPERRGSIQKVSKDYVRSVEETNNRSSLELSETNYDNFANIKKDTHPTSGLRKTLSNGQIFYDATVGTELIDSNSSLGKEKSKESSNSSEFVTKSSDQITFGQRMAKSRRIDGSFNRNLTASRKGRRYYKRNYNPDVVRRRLLKKQSEEIS